MAKIASQEALDYAAAQAPNYGVDPAMAKAILSAENMGPTGNMPDFLDTTTASGAGAEGIMQVMPATKKALQEKGFLRTEVDDTLNEWQNQIHSGLAAIQEIMKRRKTNDPSVIAADYNAGPRGGKLVEEGNHTALPAETQNYLKKVGLANAASSEPANFPELPTDFTPATRVTTGSSVSGPGGSTRTTTTSVSGIDSYVDIVRQQGTILRNLVKDVTGTGEQEVKALNEAAGKAVEAGLARADTEIAKGTIEAASAISRERILNIFGLDTTKLDNRIGVELANFESVDRERKPLAADIKERMSVGFFDNPIQWLINQTILPGAVARHNALAREQNESIEKVSTMQNLARTQEVIDVAANADQIAKLHLAASKADIAQAQERGSILSAQAASSVARTATTVASLVGRQVDDELRLAGLMKQVTSEKSASEEDAQLDKDIQRIGTMIGAPNASLASVKRMSKKDQSEWMERVAKNKAGRNLADSITFINEYGDPNVIARTGSAEFATVVKQISDEALRSAKVEANNPMLAGQGAKKPSLDDLLRGQLDGLETRFFAERQDMMLASRINPYVVNHASTAMTWKSDPNNVVYKMSNDAIKKNIKINDANIFASVKNLIDTDQMQPRDAAMQLAEYYTAAIQRNNQARSPHLLGMQPQDDYIILPKGAKLRMNLVNPIDVENYFTASVATRKANREFFETMSPFLGGA